MTRYERLPENAPRIDLAKLAPDVFKVEIRASQINHCAYCIDVHTKDALAHGESVDHVVQLSARGESRHFYTATEGVTARNVPGHYTPAPAH